MATSLNNHVIKPARQLIDDEGVVDFRLCDGDADALCVRLNQRDIPTVIYRGYDLSGRTDAVFMPKPARPTMLIEKITALLKGKDVSVVRDIGAYNDPVLQQIRKELPWDMQVFERTRSAIGLRSLKNKGSASISTNSPSRAQRSGNRR